MASSKIVLYLFMFAMLIFGTMNTIVGKAMDLSHSNGHIFNHPYFQTAGMFLGEFFCLFYYFLYKKFNKEEFEQNEPLKPRNDGEKRDWKERMGKKLFVIPAFFDFTASTLMFLGLILSAPSVYQMLRGFIMIVVAFYSIIFLKLTLFRHQYLGVILAFIGVTLVGIASIMDKASSAKSPTLGVIIILVGQFFAGGVFVSEQLFLENVVVHPLQAVGIEGTAGFGYYLIVLPILNLIPCSNGDFCTEGYVENSIDAFIQLGKSWQLMLLFFGFMLSISLFNFTGVTTTKKAGALARSTIDTSRTILVWVFSIFVGWEKFIPMQLAGFVCLVGGTLIYNEIIVLPFWGFKEAIENKKIYLKNRAEKRNLIVEDDAVDYLGYSPGAVYDQSHFKHKAHDDDISLEFK